MIEKIDSYPTWAYKKDVNRWSPSLYTFILLTGEREATPKEMSLSFKPEFRKIYTVSKIARLYQDKRPENMRFYSPSSSSGPIGEKIYGHMLDDWILLKRMSSRTKRNIFQTILSI